MEKKGVKFNIFIKFLILKKFKITEFVINFYLKKFSN